MKKTQHEQAPQPVQPDRIFGAARAQQSDFTPTTGHRNPVTASSFNSARAGMQQMMKVGSNSARVGLLSVQRKGAVAEMTTERAVTRSHGGLPASLKTGIEALSGMPMDHVKVHYNSDKPAQLQAHAYAQGNEIHLGVGQERHLPHEAWHVVQQAQGRVRPTFQMKAGAVNDEPSLEKEADMMGEKAARFEGRHGARNLMAEERAAGLVTQRVANFSQPVQLLVRKNDSHMAALAEAKVLLKDCDTNDLEKFFDECPSIKKFKAATQKSVWETREPDSPSEASSSSEQETKKRATPSEPAKKETEKEKKKSIEENGFGESKISESKRPPVATKRSILNAKKSEYQRYPAVYAASILKCGGTVGGVTAAPRSPEKNGQPETVEVLLALGAHKVQIHYHPHVVEGIGVSAVHAKIKGSDVREKLTERQLAEWKVPTLATIRDSRWTKVKAEVRGKEDRWAHMTP